MLCDADASIAIAMASFALAMTPNEDNVDALLEDDDNEEEEEEEEEEEDEASACSLACAAACALADTGANAVSVVSVRSADCSPRGSGAVGKGNRATSSMPIDLRCSTVPSSGRRLMAERMAADGESTRSDVYKIKWLRRLSSTICVNKNRTKYCRYSTRILRF